MTFSSRAFLLLACLFLLASGRSLAGPVEDGEEALRQGNPQLALRFFKIAIKADPDNEKAWSGYQKASLSAQGTDRKVPTAPVVEEAGEQAEVTPSDVSNRYLRGEPLFYSKDLEKLVERPLKPKLRVEEAIYNQEKETLTRHYVRKRGGSMALSATLFTPRLYTFLARVRANKGKLGSAGAKELWLKEADKSFRTLEFYLVLKNLTYEGGINAQRKNLDINEIEKRIFLEDDRGVRYEPYKSEPPKTDLLVNEDSMTVWFAPISRTGSPLWEGAVSELRLVIEDVEGEARRIVFPFKKSTFRRLVQIEP